MVDGNSATDLRRWCSAQELFWLEAIEVVATDPAESDQNETLGHQGRKADPIYRIRKLLHSDSEPRMSAPRAHPARAAPRRTLTSFSEPGWPKNRCATSPGPRGSVRPACASRKAIVGR